jgi:hypothetical protein
MEPVTIDYLMKTNIPAEMDGVRKSINSATVELNSSFEKITGQSEKAGRIIPQSFLSVDQSIKNTDQSIARLRAALRYYEVSLEQIDRQYWSGAISEGKYLDTKKQLTDQIQIYSKKLEETSLSIDSQNLKTENSIRVNGQVAQSITSLQSVMQYYKNTLTDLEKRYAYNLISEEKYFEQHAKYTALLDGVINKYDEEKSAIDSRNSKAEKIIETNGQVAQSITSLQSAMQYYQSILTQLEERYGRNLISEEKYFEQQARYAALLGETAKKYDEEKRAIDARSESKKKEIKDNEAAADSIVKVKEKISELQKQYESLSKSERNGAFGQKIKSEMEGLKKEIAQTGNQTNKTGNIFQSFFSGMSGGFSGLVKKVGILGGAIAAGVKAWKGYKSIMASTAETSKQFEASMYGIESGVEAAKQSIATFDFKNFFNNVFRAIAAATDYYDTMIKIANLGRSYGLGNAKLEAENAKLSIDAYDLTLTPEQRKAAFEKMIANQIEINKRDNEIADRNLKNAWKKNLKTYGVKKSDVIDYLYNYKDVIFDKDAELKKLDDQIPRGVTTQTQGNAGSMTLFKPYSQKQRFEIADQMKIDPELLKTWKIQKSVGAMSAEDIKELNDAELAVTNTQAQGDLKIKRLNVGLSRVTNKGNRMGAAASAKELKDALKEQKEILKAESEELKDNISSWKFYGEAVEKFGKQTADTLISGIDMGDKSFQDAIKDGETFNKFLTDSEKELTGKLSSDSLTKEQKKVYADMLANVKNAILDSSVNEADILKKELDRKKKLYEDDILAYKQYLKERKDAVKDDSSPAGIAKNTVLDYAMTETDLSIKADYKGLIKAFAGFTKERLLIEKQYNDDVAVLRSQLTDTSSEEDIAAVNASVEKRRETYDADVANYYRAVAEKITADGQLNDAVKEFDENAQKGDGIGKKIMNAIFLTESQKLAKENLKKLQKQLEAYSEELLNAQKGGESEEVTKRIKANILAIKKALKEAGEEADKAFGEGLINAAGILRGIAGSISELSADMASVVEDTADLLEIAGQAASGDYIDAALNAVTKVFSVLSETRAAEKAAAEDAKRYTESLVEMQWSLTEASQQRLLDEKRITAELYKQIQASRQVSEDQAENYFERLIREGQFTRTETEDRDFLGIKTGEKSVENTYNAYDEIIRQLGIDLSARAEEIFEERENNTGDPARFTNPLAGKKLTGKSTGTKFLDGYFDKEVLNNLTKATQINGIKSKLSLEELLSDPEEYRDYIMAWYEANKDRLTADTKFLLEMYLKTYQSAENAEKKIEEMTETLTGFTADSLAESLTDGFARGLKSAEDFGSDLNEIIRNAVISALVSQTIAPALEELQKQLAEEISADSVIDANDRESFQRFKESVGQKAEEWASVFAGLNDAFDGILTDHSNAKGLAGGISALTETTGTEIVGQFSAMRLHTAQLVDSMDESLQLNRNSLLYLAEIAQNTAYCSRLDDINGRLARMEHEGIKVN